MTSFDDLIDQFRTTPVADPPETTADDPEVADDAPDTRVFHPDEAHPSKLVGYPAPPRYTVTPDAIAVRSTPELYVDLVFHGAVDTPTHDALTGAFLTDRCGTLTFEGYDRTFETAIPTDLAPTDGTGDITMRVAVWYAGGYDHTDAKVLSTINDTRRFPEGVTVDALAFGQEA